MAHQFVLDSSSARARLSVSYLGGNENTHELAGGYSNLWGPFGVSADVRAFTTDGYFITPSTVRGSVDDRANVRFVTGTLHLDYLGARDRLALRFDTLAEERQNGTALQNNSTGLGTLLQITRTPGSTTSLPLWVSIRVNIPQHVLRGFGHAQFRASDFPSNSSCAGFGGRCVLATPCVRLEHRFRR